MPFLHPLIPSDPVALAAMDMLLHVMHLSLMGFIVFGACFPRLAPLHLTVVTVVWLSWLVLGLYVGNLGYCVLTDWQWQVKRLRGETGLPLSYVTYLYERLTGQQAHETWIANLTAATLLVMTLVSAWRFWQWKKRRNP